MTDWLDEFLRDAAERAWRRYSACSRCGAKQGQRRCVLLLPPGAPEQCPACGRSPRVVFVIPERYPEPAEDEVFHPDTGAV